MRYLCLASLVFCCILSGCSDMDQWGSNGQRDGSNSINLAPTRQEDRAGDR